MKQFSGMNPVVLTLDAYYHDLSHLDPAVRERRNFDVPEALNHELLREQLLALAHGNAIDKPVYDFATHTCSPQSERVVPGDMVVVEGLFALYWEEIRDLFHTRVFVAINDQVCLSRRIERDTKERGRSRESVLSQYNGDREAHERGIYSPYGNFCGSGCKWRKPVSAIRSPYNGLCQRY